MNLQGKSSKIRMVSDGNDDDDTNKGGTGAPADMVSSTSTSIEGCGYWFHLFWIPM